MKTRIILLALIIALTGCSHPAPSAPPAPAPSESGVGPKEKIAGVEYVEVVKPCPENQPVVAMDESLFTTPPAGTTWYLDKEINSGAIPQIPGGGPMQIITDGFRHCYTHSPKGVLAAAHNLPFMGNSKYLARMVLWLKADWPTRNQVYEDTLAASFSPQPRPEKPGEFVGYRIESYAPDRSVVTVAARAGGEPTLQAMTLAFIWQDNDWRLEVAVDGSASSASDRQPRQIPSLEGYVKWKG